jgi:hypothetical protein
LRDLLWLLTGGRASQPNEGRLKAERESMHFWYSEDGRGIYRGKDGQKYACPSSKLNPSWIRIFPVVK